MRELNIAVERPESFVTAINDLDKASKLRWLLRRRFERATLGLLEIGESQAERASLAGHEPPFSRKAIGLEFAASRITKQLPEHLKQPLRTKLARIAIEQGQAGREPNRHAELARVVLEHLSRGEAA